jgi:imidazolonepropionase-like amidohydrolase
MPGFRMHEDVRPHAKASFEVSEADAKQAARQGTFVVTTLVGATQLDLHGPDAAKRHEQDALNSRNLKLLHASGVRIAIGSDSYRVDTLPEALYLASLGAVDNLSLLKMWCETTVQTIFPRRKVGFLKEGYEANFLVLGGNPLTDFANVKAIRLRVKRGAVLKVPEAEKK